MFSTYSIIFIYVILGMFLMLGAMIDFLTISELFQR